MKKIFKVRYIFDGSEAGVTVIGEEERFIAAENEEEVRQKMGNHYKILEIKEDTDWEIHYRLRDALCNVLLLFGVISEAEDTMYEHDFWSDGSEVLCATEEQADMIADFFEACGFDGHTNYYDPEIDKRNGETDNHTGWWTAYWD